MKKNLVSIVISMLLFATFSSVAVNLEDNVKGDIVMLSDIHEEWSQTFGGIHDDRGYSVQKTNDDGYIISGVTSSYGIGTYDLWLIKTDSSGNEVWNKTLGGHSLFCTSLALQETDGSYIIVGSTTYGAGALDVWLIKTDSFGNEIWNQTFGGSSFDVGESVLKTDDGYIIVGITMSYGAGDRDVWLIKTDQDGNEEWNQTFGGNSTDSGYSVQQTNDSGYIITGTTGSYDAGNSDVWLIKTDLDGNEEWNKTFGRSGYYDYGYSVQQLDDGYIVTGYTYSYGAGGSDVWLIKVYINNPPETPDQPDGPTDWYVRVEYTYTTNTVTEPNGDDIIYGWDWDGNDAVDDWTDEPTASHFWDSSGIYDVKVKAKDIYGAESEWSTGFTVTITSGVGIPQLIITAPSSVMEEERFDVTITVFEEGIKNVVEGANIAFNGETEQTDSNGQVTFTAPEVDNSIEYAITASFDDSASATETITVLNQIEKKGWIWGQVTDNYRNYIENASVCAILSDEGTTSECTFTDEQGRCHKQVLIGTYTAEASKKRYESSSEESITVSENVAVEVNFVLTKLENDTGSPFDENQKRIDEAIEAGYIAAEIDIPNDAYRLSTK